MKLAKILMPTLLLSMGTFVQAESVDEIISTYHETIGGEEALRAMQGLKISAELTQGPMTFPLEIVQQASGERYTKATVQGQVIYQGVFDGEVLWNTNFMTMKAEKAQTEQTENMKLELNDFPDSLMDYKEKGYAAELMGTETVDGEDAFKIKLTKEPIMVEGQQKPNVEYYYFDSEAMILVMTENEVNEGPMKGQIQQIKMSDYQEVDGIYFPFSMAQSIKGQPGGAPMTITSIELNPTVDETVFAFPAAQ
jgi:hypothetical protein